MDFAELKSRILQAVYPEGQADNLIFNHEKWIVDALIDLAKKVQCLQLDQLEKVPQCATYYLCGASVFCAPVGYLQRLYTITEGYECNRVDYQAISKDEFDCLSATFNTQVTLLQPYPYFFNPGTGLYQAFPDLGVPGMVVPDSTIDKPCRASTGYWTLHNGNIYMFPYMQWNETAVIEWEGIKRVFADTDTVSYDREVEDAVEMYLRWKSATVEDNDLTRAREFLEGPPQTIGQGYNGLVATMIWDCRKRMRIRRRPPCFSNCSSIWPCACT